MSSLFPFALFLASSVALPARHQLTAMPSSPASSTQNGPIMCPRRTRPCGVQCLAPDLNLSGGGSDSTAATMKYSSADIRFTSKGDDVLFALAFDWPENGELLIRSLAKPPGARERISRVELLGRPGRLKWTQTADGLRVRLPPKQSWEHALTLKITGKELRAAAPPGSIRRHGRRGFAAPIVSGTRFCRVVK